MYGCACCPSQICRFLPSIGNYIYRVSNDAVWVNLYIGNQASVKYGKKDMTLTQETNYPWEGAVKITIGTKSPVNAEMRLRIPGWCKSYTIKVNGAEVKPQIESGYAELPGKWSDGDAIELNMDMPVEVVAADPRTKEDEGMRAIQRGPIVYCIEEADNKDGFDDLKISLKTLILLQPSRKTFLMVSSLLTPRSAIRRSNIFLTTPGITGRRVK